MPSDNDDKLITSAPPDESTAEMDVIKDLFGQEQPQVATVEVFSEDLFSEPAPAAPEPPAAAPNPTPAPAAESALPYQPKAEEDIKVVTDEDLVDLFSASSIGRTAPAMDEPEPEAPAVVAEPEPTPAAPPEPEPEPEAAVEAAPEPIAQHVEAEELSLDGVAEIDPAAVAEAAPEPAPAEEPAAPLEAEPADAPVVAQHETVEEITSDFLTQSSEPGPAPAEEEPAAAPADEESAATPVDAVDFRREQVEEELGLEHPMPEVDTGMKSAITAENVEIGQIAEEVHPPSENPLEDISPDEIVANLESRCEVGEMTSVAAGKKGELLEKTEGLLKQLEPTGNDLLSVAELTKLYNNMNVLIEWARTMSQRMDRLEAALARLSPEDDE